MTARMLPAITKLLCCHSRREAPLDAAVASSRSAVEAVDAELIRLAMRSARSDARIEPRVDQVRREREPDIEHRHQQQHGLHDRKILAADRLPCELPDAL